jgi:hypothetical protein
MSAAMLRRRLRLPPPNAELSPPVVKPAAHAAEVAILFLRHFRLADAAAAGFFFQLSE